MFPWLWEVQGINEKRYLGLQSHSLNPLISASRDDAMTLSHITDSLWGEPLVTVRFPSQKASDAEL